MDRCLSDVASAAAAARKTGKEGTAYPVVRQMLCDAHFDAILRMELPVGCLLVLRGVPDSVGRPADASIRQWDDQSQYYPLDLRAHGFSDSFLPWAQGDLFLRRSCRDFSFVSR